jgi:hydrogenase nickel incorporation protein HypA/HybF
MPSLRNVRPISNKSGVVDLHEYSIVQALLAQVAAEAQLRGATSVQRVVISIGELAGIEIGLLKTAFERFRERTICETTDLVVNQIAAVWTCRNCGRRRDTQNYLRCNVCERPFDLVRGDEIVLEKIDMEVPNV